MLHFPRGVGDRVAYFVELGLPEVLALRLVAEIAADGPMMADMDVPDDIVTLVSDLHDGSWFYAGESSQHASSRTGGRQGCELDGGGGVADGGAGVGLAASLAAGFGGCFVGAGSAAGGSGGAAVGSCWASDGCIGGEGCTGVRR